MILVIIAFGVGHYIKNTHYLDPFDLKKEQLYIDEDSRCCKCHKKFDASVFTRQSNGKLSHIMCRSDLMKL